MEWQDKMVLVTGGTGSFGKKFVEIMQKDYRPKKLIVFSRDELKQYEMKQKYDSPNMRYFIGDIRDKERLHRAMDGVDIIIHAAALKQVPSCEYNPFEAIKTNIIGAENIINTAIDNGVSKILAISTDKAVNPINLYGATKMCAEKIFIAANSYVGDHKTKISCVRYGNVVGSRGSVVPLFKKQMSSGVFSITDDRMTRFWITLEQGVRLVINSVEMMQGGEIYVPKIPSMKVTDLARAINPEAKHEYIGIRSGEKIHEILLTVDEARHSVDMGDYFVVEPEDPMWIYHSITKGKKLLDNFSYNSKNNTEWLSEEELLKMVEEV